MEINDILKLIEAVSEHGLTSFVLEENGSKISMKKEKEVITVTAAPAVQTVIAPAAADARDISGTAPSVPAGYMAPAVSAAGTEMSRSESIGSDKVVTLSLIHISLCLENFREEEFSGRESKSMRKKSTVNSR